MTSYYDLQQQGKQTHVLKHCDKPGCCVGVIIGRCERCGFLVTVGTECPATKDTDVLTSQLRIKIDRYSFSYRIPKE